MTTHTHNENNTSTDAASVPILINNTSSNQNNSVYTLLPNINNNNNNDSIMNDNSSTTTTQLQSTSRKNRHKSPKRIDNNDNNNTSDSNKDDKLPSFIPSNDQLIRPTQHGEHSRVWQVFRKVNRESDSSHIGYVWCTLGNCKGWVKRGGNGTSAMQNHLKHWHNNVYNILYNQPQQDIELSYNSADNNNIQSTTNNNTQQQHNHLHKFGNEYINDNEHPRKLIPELCKQFYTLGWVTGTGGGISIRYNTRELINNDIQQSTTSDNKDNSSMKYEQDSIDNQQQQSQQSRTVYYIAPSSVQKERMTPDDMYVLDSNQVQLSGPSQYRPSQCTPLFFNAYTLRNAGCCIHTHSQHAVMCTLLYEHEFVITHQEMIKGIKLGMSNNNYRYYDTLIVPIIENTAEERDLQQRMYDAIIQYPYSNAVLVRRHGLYVWGNTWQQAKTQCECYDYLFQIAIKMKQMNIDPTVVPHDSEYKSLCIQYKKQNTQQQRLQQYIDIHQSMNVPLS